MASDSDFFSKIAKDIISNTTKNQVSKATGLSLYEDFSSFIQLKERQFTQIKRKFVTVFLKSKKDIFSVEIQGSSIKITLNAKYGTLKDSRNFFRDVSNIGHWGNGDYQVKIEDDKDFEYILNMIKQIN
jgi:predicted transport protein